MSCSLVGANAKLAIKQEVTLGTAPTGNYGLLPFISADFGATDDVSNTPVLGYGRDKQRDARDGLTVRGRLIVPVDQQNLGYWLKAALGAATVTGTSPNYIHTFLSGSQDLPSYAIEFQHPDGSTAIYAKYSGVMVDTATFRIGARGRPQMEMGLIGIDEIEDNTSEAGTPTVPSIAWHENRKSFVTKDTVAIGKIASITVNLNNNLDAIAYVGGGGKIGCIQPGMFDVGGQLVVSTNDLTFATLAQNATLFDLAAGWSVDANHALTLEFDQAELLRTGRPIPGPGRIERTFNISSSHDFVEGSAFRAVYASQVAAY